MALATSALPAPRDLRRELALSRERMARLLSVSSKTVERWEAQAHPPRSERAVARLATLGEVVRVARLVYGPDGVRAFLTTPTREFGGRSPLQLLEQDEGDRVLATLAADYEGSVL